MWLRAGELNATRMAYEASMTPVHLLAENLVREAGVEPAASRLSIECSNHAELFPDGAPCQTRTGFSGLQVRRIADYAYRACDSGANGANRTLIGCLPCNCSPVELHRLEPEGYSKPRPPRYECGALPLELLRRKGNWSECGESNSVDQTGDRMPNQ